MKKYQALVIGCGNQGALADAPGSENEHKIISFAHAFKEHQGFIIKEFLDIDDNKMIEAYKTWEIEIPKYFKSRRENKIHKDDRGPLFNIDIAVVTTPDETHYKILKQLAEYPLRLVICEKPICETVEQAREIVELYKQKDIGLMVNYTRRFLPYYQEMKRLYDLGIYGKILNAELTFNRGWVHTATHGIDVFNWFFGDTIKPKIKYVGYEAPRRWYMTMFFENKIFEESRLSDEQPVWQYYDYSHWYVIENAYNFLEGKEQLKCTGDDALTALEICYNLMEK